MRITVDLKRDIELKIETELRPGLEEGSVMLGEVKIDLSMVDYMRLGYMLSEQLIEKGAGELLEEQIEKTGVQSQMPMATGEKPGEM